MSVPVLSDLREPPVVGRYYMVPVIRAVRWGSISADLPVIGPAHTDQDHFNFPHRHYHVDARFLTIAEKRKASGVYPFGDYHTTVGALPVTNLDYGGLPVGRPSLAKRRCTSQTAIYRHDDKPQVQALREAYGTPDAIALADGRKLCPHRKADLTQFKPDRHGFVVCPLHGLLVRCAASVTGTGTAETQSGSGRQPARTARRATPKTPLSHAETKQPPLSTGPTPAHPSEGAGPTSIEGQSK